jgi:hypothetical protein
VRPTNCPSRTTYGVVGDAGGQVNAMNGIHRGGVVRPGVWQPPLECSALEWEVMKRIKRARLLCGCVSTVTSCSTRTSRPSWPVGTRTSPWAAAGAAGPAWTGDNPAGLHRRLRRRGARSLCDGSALAAGAGLHGSCPSAVFEDHAGGVSRAAGRAPLGPAVGGAHGWLVWAADRSGGRGKRWAALDSSSWWGLGGRTRSICWATRCARSWACWRASRVGLAEGTRVLAREVGVPERGASSLKAALDLDWDDPAALPRALDMVLGAVGRVEELAGELGADRDPQVAKGLAAARQVQGQDTVVGADGVVRIRDAPRPQDQARAHRRLQAPRAQRPGSSRLG